MSVPTIAPYFPFRRIKIINQYVTAQADTAHIQVQPVFMGHSIFPLPIIFYYQLLQCVGFVWPHRAHLAHRIELSCDEYLCC